jgi:hypothetical protein
MLVVLALFVAFAGQQELLVIRRRGAQRRPASREEYPVRLREPALAPLAVPADEPASRDDNFSGLVWDHEYHVWVRWQDGRPVEAYWGAE